MCVCICLIVLYRVQVGLIVSVFMSPFIQFFLKVMHNICCDNFIIQCIPLFHHSMWKTIFQYPSHTASS
ncbi:hypothetical protein E2C01_008709 [Portunus trituberculatus]|uniref:Uncharacterized protein n=1 Tax=Portunus trituberculatus TaxID=210409 RepID=A0A5B7D3L0_PORTR|nr:hypothetical protein [Portunus trituberculatus]